MTRQKNDTLDVNESQATEDRDSTREITASCENCAAGYIGHPFGK